jgi:anti-anti-sigma regulatory factor
VTRHAGDIVLDLSNLGFSDVAGVRAIAWVSTLVADQDHAMTIVRAPRLIRRVLTLTGADMLVNVEDPQGT